MLTDEDVAVLYRHSSDARRPVWEKEMRKRARGALVRNLGNRSGVCAAHGKHGFLDETGAYSSGYFCHDDRTLCDVAGEITFDDSPERNAKLRIIDLLKE